MGMERTSNGQEKMNKGREGRERDLRRVSLERVGRRESKGETWKKKEEEEK